MLLIKIVHLLSTKNVASKTIQISKRSKTNMTGKTSKTSRKSKRSNTEK